MGVHPAAVGILFVGAFFLAGTVCSIASGYLRTAALFFDLVGLLLIMGLTVIGTGAFLVSRLGGQPADVRAHPEQPVSAAAPVPVG